jgi:uncharacterized protein involved in response to NO
VGVAQAFQQLFPRSRQVNADCTAIVRGAAAVDEAVLLEAVDQLDGAVMLEHEPLCNLADRGRFVAEAADSEQELVLLGLEPRFPRRRLGEGQKAAQLMTKLGQRGVVRRLQSGGHAPCSTKTVRKDPYRLLFPIGALLAWAGVLHWLLFGLGWFRQYENVFHAIAQIQGALTAFAFGFLLTFIPRRTRSATPSPLTITIAAASPISTTIAAWFHLWGPAQAFWWVGLGTVGVFALRRLRKNAGPPMHASFIWVPISVSAALLGSLLAATAALGPEWMWLHHVGQSLVLQGLFTGLSLGVGGMLIPLLTRNANPLDPPLGAKLARALHAVAAFVFFSGFYVEASSPRLGFMLRASAVLFVLIALFELWRLPTERGLARKVMWLSAWMLGLGYTLPALDPALRIVGLHVVFIGGFWALTIGISSHVALSHSGRNELTHATPLRFALTAALLALALAARVLVNLDPARFMLWLTTAAACFLAATLPWASLITSLSVDTASPQTTASPAA